MIHRNNLSKMLQNVALSQKRVSLLTCQVLTRPWVLADIIKAYLCGINLICVLVEGPEREKDQRAFRFPEDLRSAIESWQEFIFMKNKSVMQVPRYIVLHYSIFKMYNCMKARLNVLRFTVELELKPMRSASAVPLGAEPNVSGMSVPCGVSLKLRCCGLGRWKNAAPHFELAPRMDCERGWWTLPVAQPQAAAQPQAPHQRRCRQASPPSSAPS